MALIKLDKIKKYYGDRLILDIDKLEIFEGDRVGIVGENGAGKTTLLKIILGQILPDEGIAQVTNSYSYISQSEDYYGESQEGKYKKIIKAPDCYSDFLSGGEKLKLKISQAFSSNARLLIGDEPTANLDISGIKNIEKLISDFDGGLLLVSHDRKFLDNLCNTILEVQDGRIRIYKGNYSKYIELKRWEKERAEKEFLEYISEKSRLENAVSTKEAKRNSIRKAPKRMGNSEARLCKMGDQRGKKNLDGNIKGIKSRIEQLEVKEKPKTNKEIKIMVNKGKEMISRTVIEGKNLNLSIGGKELFNNGSFRVRKGKKVGIIGENGCGKTTLIKRILQGDSENIVLSKYISIGYFDQEQKILDEQKTILENIKLTSSLTESIIRISLDGFGFKGDDVFKKVSILSGGERVKVGLCKIILGDNNTLILDEPTNYLDIKAMEGLENALKNTDKTVVIISHDDYFISNVCNYIIEIKGGELYTFDGRYKDYVNGEVVSKSKPCKRNEEDKLIVLENRLCEVISKLSIEKNGDKKEILNNEYSKTIIEVKELREKIYSQR